VHPSQAISLVDSHCHLNFDDFDQDRSQVIERARKAGIKRILIPAVDLETSKSAIQCSEIYPEVYAAVGVHPNSGVTWGASVLDEIKRLAAVEKIVALGEIGLDYYRQSTPRVLQREMFSSQLKLAAELGLPVIIHNRDATDDIVELLSDWHQALVSSGSPLAQRPGILHSFSASVEVARTMAKINFKLGIAGPITYKNSQLLHSVVISMPLEQLLLETDAPFLTPNPFRGKRNEPANVRIIAEKIAELKQVSEETVARITTETANQLLDWSEIR
jgi:TatD DNase family protein